MYTITKLSKILPSHITVDKTRYWLWCGKNVWWDVQYSTHNNILKKIKEQSLEEAMNKMYNYIQTLKNNPAYYISDN